MYDFRFIDLFAGIGGIRIPFDELGGECVFSSEWDKFAQIMYEENFGEKPYGDITDIPNDTIPAHDILLAGFPCQAFSIMGNKLGFADTRGTMFFEIERILEGKRPSAFLLENVKQLRTHDKGRTLQIILSKLEALGYKVKYDVLNALDFGLPQKRERIIIVGFLNHDIEFEFPKGSKSNDLTLNDILENDEEVDKKYWAKPNIIEKRIEKTKHKEVFYPSVWHENKAGEIGVNDFACALRTGASYNYQLVNGKRRFTLRELLRLQGFPETFKIVVSDQQIRRQTGNSVAIPVIRAVAKKMLAYMYNNPEVFNNVDITEKEVKQLILQGGKV
jgi:DNA (cytosine-5)-methyltransferase 1